MKKLLLIMGALVAVFGCTQPKKEIPIKQNRYVSIDGLNLVKPNDDIILLKGINLGNWLNPEGYMFFFKNASSYRLINEAFSEMVGPDFTNWFWDEYRKNYITHDDIKYIKQTGINSVRLPFHYKIFTDEDFMGVHGKDLGFEVVDSVVSWCKQEGLYVILNMHDAPGGQTGDNMDDSYGYPWLFESEENQAQFCSIWKSIAQRYAKDTTVIGYELLNEPLAEFFVEKDPKLNDLIEPLYIRCVDSIRTVDPNHIVFLAGAQANSNFNVFKNPYFDSKLMYSCHRYGCDTTQAAIADLVQFRDRVNRPMLMSETGENSNKWIAAFAQLLEQNNIGWNFWSYKDMTSESCMKTIQVPKNWYLIVEYTQQNRSDIKKIRVARPDQKIVRKAMLDLLENMKYKNCTTNDKYIEALGMQP